MRVRVTWDVGKNKRSTRHVDGGRDEILRLDAGLKLQREKMDERGAGDGAEMVVLILEGGEERSELHGETQTAGHC